MYRQTTIKGILDQINAGEIFLPVFQRKFVWKETQMTKLFDSILRGYPIGTFLFWKLRQEHANANIFYRFIQDYNELNNYQNQPAAFPILINSIYGVLDGQQRLSALYMALQGSYASKLPRFARNNPAAYPVKQLYLNLMAIEEHQAENETPYEFRFLTLAESMKTDSQNLWFRVKDLLLLTDIGFVTDVHTELQPKVTGANIQQEFGERWPEIFRVLTKLYSYLTMNHYICYYEVDNPYIDDVLSMFIRINSAGTVLEKTDLLFSTIVANWQDGRRQIEHFLQEINSMGNGFKFRIDFFMRSCLCLSDIDVLFKVDAFNADNINRIQNNFAEITDAIRQAVQILVRLGFSSETLSSQNIVIPIAYYFRKGGQPHANAISEIKQFLHRALIKNVFSSHGDSLLDKIRTALNENGNVFTVSSISAKLPRDKSLSIGPADIDEMLTYKKGRDAFLVLALLYPDLRFSQVVFHQDHIHPASAFVPETYQQFGLTEEQVSNYNSKRDMVPNLQLLEGPQNIRKSATPLTDWINRPDLNERERTQYLTGNFIEPGWETSFQSFEAFFNNRRELIKQRLIQMFGLQGGQDDRPDGNNDGPLNEGGPVNDPAGGNDAGGIHPEAFPNPVPPVDPLPVQNAAALQQENPADPERIKLKILGDLLIPGEFGFIGNGTYDLKSIYRAVQANHPELCNDNYLCLQNCRQGGNEPEWHHKVRGCLDQLKKKNGRVKKNPNVGYWDFE